MDSFFKKDFIQTDILVEKLILHLKELAYLSGEKEIVEGKIKLLNKVMIYLIQKKAKEENNLNFLKTFKAIE